jgi:hypothetical protein
VVSFSIGAYKTELKRNKTSLPISAWLQSHKTFFFVHLPSDKAASVTTSGQALHLYIRLILAWTNTQAYLTAPFGA